MDKLVVVVDEVIGMPDVEVTIKIAFGEEVHFAEYVSQLEWK
jgi:hypothetical protein